MLSRLSLWRSTDTEKDQTNIEEGFAMEAGLVHPWGIQRAPKSVIKKKLSSSR